MNKAIKLAVFLALSLGAKQTQAQVGIGTTTPNNSAQLDITSNNKGLLIPRVSLLNVTNSTTPVATPATGLLVYNTNAGTTGGSGAGFYYWNGAEWVRLSTKPSSDWTLSGNTGTNPNTNYIGTGDAQALVFRTNAVERMRISEDGPVSVNEDNPYPEDNFGAFSTVAAHHAVNGYSDPTGVGIYGSLNRATSTSWIAAAGCFNANVRAISALSNHVDGIGIDVSAGNPTNAQTATGVGGLFNAAKFGIIAYADNTDATRYAGKFIGNVTTGNRPQATLAGNVNPTTQAGVFGSSDNVGVYGSSNGALGGYGVYSDGDIFINGATTANGDVNGAADATFTGDITGATKAFTIDHPTDPKNKYLRHYSIESNELVNVYRGSATFNFVGEVTITLPSYYSAINTDATYQLTPIGRAMSLYVKKEITSGKSGTTFTIAGGFNGQKVSWAVIAKRNDKYVQHHSARLINEIDKPADKKGKYLHPAVWGVAAPSAPKSKAKGTITADNNNNELKIVPQKDRVKTKKAKNKK